MSSLITLLVTFTFCVCLSQAQYEDVRCKCVCPSPAVVNATASDRKLYIGNVNPDKCDCEHVVLPSITGDVKGKEFCPRCECKYESRNTTTIRVVVIIIICIISLLVIYMLFLMCLDPLLYKRAAPYQEHTNEEEDNIPMPSTSRRMSGSVLNRVGHQQTKWKQQVQEQRKNIYDRHTMLN